MNLPRSMRRLWSRGWNAFFPPDISFSLENTESWRRTETEWRSDVSAFKVQAGDADVLHLASGDGRLLRYLLDGNPPGGPARHAVAIDIGPGGGTDVWPSDHRRMQRHVGISYLTSFDPQSFDLVLCYELDRVFALEHLEDGLARIFSLLRPGGEAIYHFTCAHAGAPDRDEFLTASLWIMLLMRAGFEVAGVHRFTGDSRAEEPWFEAPSDTVTAAMRVHLIRPWEPWELERLRTTDEESIPLKARRKKKRRKATPEL